MCVTRRENMQESIGLKGGATCVHRRKKNLFKSSECRKKLKATPSTCDECTRLKSKKQDENDDLFMCISCGQVGCEEHAKKHAEAHRTGGEHALMITLNNFQLRCQPCDVDLEPLDEQTDLVRTFVNEYKNFTKTKAVAKAAKKEESKPAEVPEVENVPVASNNVKQVASTSAGPIESDKKSVKTRSKANGFAHNGDTMIPAKGLPNLGNTCFFNSVMQCVMHTHHMQQYFEKFGRVTKLTYEENQTVNVYDEKIDLEACILKVPQEQCPLNNVLRGFLSEFRCGSSLSPSPVFSQISRKAPRFKGWQQQDAHELLRYLMDGLRSEEQERYKIAIASHFGLSPKANPKKTDPAIVKKAKGYLQAAGRPLLDIIFGGTLLQTIRCVECGHISERNEQFLDLSIPLSSNPMSARAAAGRTQLSAHQKKKLEKQSKKDLRRQARQGAAKKHVDESNGQEDEGKLEELEKEMEDVDISDDEENEEDEERLVSGINPIDNTRVLVPAPVEYGKQRCVGTALLEFTAEEMLADSNRYECEKCCAPRNKKVDAKGAQKKRVDAVKRYLIYEPPAILTLHLKRFQQTASFGRGSTQKLGGHVDFPLLFDIAPFCCKNVERIAPNQKQILYSLYGVVVHSGNLSGGHYIAYVKSRHWVEKARSFLEYARASCVDSMEEPVASTIPSINIIPEKAVDGQWYYVSDSHVQTVAESRVLAAEAYILFYERVY